MLRAVSYMKFMVRENAYTRACLLVTGAFVVIHDKLDGARVEEGVELLGRGLRLRARHLSCDGLLENCRHDGVCEMNNATSVEMTKIGCRVKRLHVATAAQRINRDKV